MPGKRVLYLIFALTTGILFTQAGESLAFDGYVEAGLGRMYGDNTYQIGGNYYGPGLSSQAGSFHFPISKLEFPTEVYMASLTGGFTIKNRFEFSGNFKKNLTDTDGEVRDSDYTIPNLKDTYSESDGDLDSYTFQADFLWRVYKGLFLGAGYLHQSFDYDVENVRQWYPLGDITGGDALAGDYIGGLGATYKVTYYIPYLSFTARGKVTDNFTVESSLKYSPYTMAKDDDNHILRDRTAEGDCDGYAVIFSLKGKYDLPKNWFLTATFDYTRIDTDGEQETFMNGQWQWTIDETIESTQTYFMLGGGYSF